MVAIDPNRDYYDVLGVGQDAALGDIKQAYRQLARRFHPDTGHGDIARFRLVQEAYEVLSDTTYRRAYDRQRIRRGRHRDAPIEISSLLNTQTLPPRDCEQMLYAVVDIQAKEKLRNARQRLNIALVIDCSTSMRGTRMHNVKMATNDLIDSMHPDDRLSVVTFSDRAEVIAPSEAVKKGRRFRSSVAAMTASGGTEIYQGLSLGIEQVKQHWSSDTINHVILLTDGRTYGDEDVAIQAARRAGKDGMGISAFGIGEDWNDVFLDNLARYGGGVSLYIDRPSKVREALKSEINGLTKLVVRKGQLLANSVSYVKLLNAFRVTPHMERLSVQGQNIVKIGDLSSGDPVTLVLEFIVHHNERGKKRLARLEFSGQNVHSSEPVKLHHDIRVNFSEPSEENAVPSRLLNLVARLSVFRLQEQAWLALDSGNPHQATHYLESAATHLFDMGYRELGRAAMLEVGRISRGTNPTDAGRKKLRYGTRSLSIPSS